MRIHGGPRPQKAEPVALDWSAWTTWAVHSTLTAPRSSPYAPSRPCWRRGHWWRTSGRWRERTARAELGATAKDTEAWATFVTSLSVAAS